MMKDQLNELVSEDKSSEPKKDKERERVRESGTLFCKLCRS